MKKALSLLLVFAMLLSSMLLLSSCDRISVNSVSKAPAKTLSKAYSNTMSSFFGDGIGLYELLNKNARKSAFEIYFESEELLGNDISRIDATIYTDQDASRRVLDASISYKGEPLSARLFTDNSGIILESESMLGENGPIGLFYDSFIEKFEDSALAAFLGLEPEDAAEIIDTVREFKDSLNEDKSENAKLLLELSEDIMKTFKQAVTAEEVTVGEDKISCIVLTYEINNQTLSSALYQVYNVLFKPYDSSRNFRMLIEQIISELDKAYKYELIAKVALSASDNEMVSISIGGKVTEIAYYNPELDTYLQREGEISLGASFGSNKIELVYTGKFDADEYSLSLILEKSVSKSDTVYGIRLNAKENNKSIEIANAKLMFDKDGKFEIEIKLYDLDTTLLDISLLGTYKITRNKAKFEFLSAKSGDSSVEFKLGMAFDKSPDVPKAPSEPEDIIDLKKSDLEKLAESFKNSEIGKLFGGDR